MNEERLIELLNAEIDGELDAADLCIGSDVAGDPHHEQVAQPLVKDNFRRHPGIGTTEYHGEGRLAAGDLPKPIG